ncbi:short-chain dehydrogenase reductase sdr [Fusarium denticulatum]|uniref:Short-chain dehydrogenase reductase sdr n=1 Tax=Fusarium denticulatum TaxID=48507 RepID=A0A8H5SXD4_9HYPO|nr:short-chain dehydrogenase reductase sdr [Fusarium denticulatum]
MSFTDKPPFVSTLHHEPYPVIDPRKPTNSAAGKTISITCGATSIGFATTRAFRYRRSDNDCASSVSRFLTYAARITDEAEIKKSFSSVRQTERNKDVDVLVTCAAYIKVGTPLARTSLSEVTTTIETNMTGNLIVVQAFLDTPKEEGKAIVDITSSASYIVFTQSGVYGASKAAYSYMMRHVQHENPNMRICNLHPGAV